MHALARDEVQSKCRVELRVGEGRKDATFGVKIIFFFFFVWIKYLKIIYLIMRSSWINPYYIGYPTEFSICAMELLHEVFNRNEHCYSAEKKLI